MRRSQVFLDVMYALYSNTGRQESAGIFKAEYVKWYMTHTRR